MHYGQSLVIKSRLLCTVFDSHLREALKKKPKKFGNFPNFPDPPPPIVWKFPKFQGFFQVSQKHLETNAYVLIHPELQKKYFQTKVCCCTVQFCTVRYCTVQGTTPPHKSEFFFFAFLDESGHLQCFPNAFRKNPKKSKKKFGIGQDPMRFISNLEKYVLYNE